MRPLFSAREMADLRVLDESAMRDSGTVLRMTLLDDGRGGQYPDPAGPAQIGSVLGRFKALSGEELIRAAQLGQLGRYRWAVPVTTDIRETDQVLLLGVAYSVVWAPPAGALDADRIVGLEEASTAWTVSPAGHGLLTEAGGGLLTENGDFIVLEASTAIGAFLLETGDFLLLETGDQLLIEA